MCNSQSPNWLGTCPHIETSLAHLEYFKLYVGFTGLATFWNQFSIWCSLLNKSIKNVYRVFDSLLNSQVIRFTTFENNFPFVFFLYKNIKNMTGFWAKFLAVFGHKLRFISEHFVLIGLNAARHLARVIQMAFNTHTRLRSQSVFNTPVCS